MNIRFVPFEELDRNKWNGTIHYAPNGNIYGYHWYLKSVIKEWDAIIEGDYQSVMPLPRISMTTFEKSLLPYLGPYTVNEFSAQRAQSFYNLWKEYSVDGYYSFNDKLGKIIYDIDPTLSEQPINFIDLSPSYENIYDNYSTKAIDILNESTAQSFMYGSDIKPEKLLEKEKMSEIEKNTLYRIMYNAIQRGVGWSLAVEDNNSSKSSKSFFVNDNSGIYEIFTSTRNTEEIHLLMLDTLIRSNAGKSINLLLHPLNTNLLHLLGGNLMNIFVTKTTKVNFASKLISFFSKNHGMAQSNQKKYYELMM